MKKFFIFAVCFAAVLFASCEPTLTPQVKEYGFSVSSTKKVIFSPGNLQYDRMSRTWSFAENQYDALGANNIKGSAFADKIDLFGWSGSNSAVAYGVNISGNLSDYTGDFVDWGMNKIGEDEPNTWRTLSHEELVFLISGRLNAEHLIGVAEVNGVNGLVLLPDEWVCPGGVVFKSGFASESGESYYGQYQRFTAAEWLKLEHAGAVFLPAAGYRYKNEVMDANVRSYYWTSTAAMTDGYAYLLVFDSHMADTGYITCYVGQPVRLVKDLQ